VPTCSVTLEFCGLAGQQTASTVFTHARTEYQVFGLPVDLSGCDCMQVQYSDCHWSVRTTGLGRTAGLQGWSLLPRSRG